MRFIMAHEYGHNLGLPHLELGSRDPSVNYGAYGLMRGSVLTPSDTDSMYQNDGFMSLHPRSLATLGWIGVETVESAEAFVLPNLRSASGYTIEIPATSIGGTSSLESFILSYHENHGWDADYPSSGVAIWHNRYAGESSVNGWMDPEIASKRWECNHSSGIEDADTGVDKCDRRWWTANAGCDTQHIHYDAASFSYYWPGQPNDFFNPAWCATDTWGGQEVVEFSFRTNPNTNLSISASDRLAGDTIETSLAVLMAFPDLGGSPTVTVMPAPYELILTPVTGAEVAVGDTVEVTWDDYFAGTIFADTIMDQVDVSFSRDGSAGSFAPVQYAAYGAHACSWVVDDRFVSIGDTRGQLKVEFTNTVNDLVGSQIVDAIKVNGVARPWEWLISPAGGDELYVGTETRIEWTAGYEADVTSVDIDYSTDGGGSWLPIPASVDDYNVGPDRCWIEFTPTADMVGPEVRLRLTCHYDGYDDSVDESVEPFTVYHPGAGFRDRTADADPSGDNWYVGIPSDAVSLRLDPTESAQEDLLFAMETEDDGEGVVAYEMSYQFDTPAADRAEGADTFPDGIPAEGSRGLAVGDLDLDGDKDLVVCQAGGTGVRVYLQAADGAFHDATDDVFHGDDLPLLARATDATIVDADHNGLPDLFIFLLGNGSLPSECVLFESAQEPDPTLQFKPGDWPLPMNVSTAAWADCDADGYWEVVVGGVNTPPRVVIEQDGAFQESAQDIPGALTSAVSACWFDADKEEKLDLAILTRDQGLVVVSGGSGDRLFERVVEVITMPADWSGGGVAAVDHDLDGWMDLVVTGAGAGDETLVAMNLQDPTLWGRRFQLLEDMSGWLTKPDGLPVYGMAVADFDGDRAPDLALARERDPDETIASGLFFENEAEDIGGPERNWIAFDFENLTQPPYLPLGVPFLGTRITIFDGAEVLAEAVVEPNRFAGGQNSSLMVIGLGSHSTPVTYHLNMPTTYVGTGYSNVNQVVDVNVQIPTCGLLDDDVTCQVTVDAPTATLDWLFTWRTTTWSAPEKDKVTIRGDIVADLYNGVADVTVDVRYVFDAATGQHWYLHELRWNQQPCQVNASYEYWATTTGIGDTDHGFGRFKVCPQSN